MTRLVGLTGPARGRNLPTAGCGKDTAAQALVTWGWKRQAFADRMRDAMLALDPYVITSMADFKSQPTADHTTRLSQVIEWHGWDEAKRTYPEIRRLLQRFGTEAGRDIHGQDCWVDALFRDNQWVIAEGNGLVVTDCRFENEAKAIRSEGGIVVSIERPGMEMLPGGHSSEAGLPISLIDYTIQNTGTVRDLHDALMNIVNAAAINGKGGGA